jgi:hypothetical protein
MGRLPDWPALLARHILEATDRAFEWGRHDCSVFAADGILAITGRDPIARARGRYACEKRAAVILREIGGLGVPEAAETLMIEFGAPPVHPAFAQRGDLILIRVPVAHLRPNAGVGGAAGVRAENNQPGGALRAEKQERAAGARAEKDFCLGLIAPNGCVAVAALRGLAFFDPREAARAWRI